MDKITFSPNVPCVVTLKYNEPREVDSQFVNGSQYLYSTKQGAMYVSPHLHSLIQESGAKAGATLKITKSVRKIAGSKPQTAWTVEPARDNTLSVPAPHPDSQENTFDAFMRQQESKSKAQAVAPAPVALGNPMAQALCLALDAAAIATDHARKLNLPIAWSSVDIIGIANTIMSSRKERV